MEGGGDSTADSTAVALYRVTVRFHDDGQTAPISDMECVFKICRLEEVNGTDATETSRFEREGAIYTLMRNDTRVISSLYFGRFTPAKAFVTIKGCAVRLDPKLFGILRRARPGRAFVAIVTAYNPTIVNVHEFVVNRRRALPRMFLVDASTVLGRLRKSYGFVHWDLHYENQMVDTCTGEFHVLDFDLSTVSLHASETVAAMTRSQPLRVIMSKHANGPSAYADMIMLEPMISLLVAILTKCGVVRSDPGELEIIIGHGYDKLMLYNGVRRCHKKLQSMLAKIIPDMVYPGDYGAYLVALKTATALPSRTKHCDRVMDQWILKKDPNIPPEAGKQWRKAVSMHIHILFGSILFVAIGKFGIKSKSLLSIVPDILEKWTL